MKSNVGSDWEIATQERLLPDTGVHEIAARCRAHLQRDGWLINA